MSEILPMQEPVCISDFEKYAEKFLPKNAWDYFSAGANACVSLKENRRAFDRLRIRPRILRDVSSINMSTTILGEKIDFPICVAPTAMQKMAHSDGEVATTKAAATLKTCMILSTWSTSSMEDVGNASSGLKWFQLFVCKDQSVTVDLIERAVAAGFKAIVVTVDTPYLGRRYADVRNQFALPSHLELGNYTKKYATAIKSDKDSGRASFEATLYNSSLTWKIIPWLKSVTKLPIVLKGILTAEDAKLAVSYGVDGILVSNHGARQLDFVPATVEALPEVISAVNGKCEVYLDGGIRYGSDVFKSLALGARAVFVGRPIVWGLAYKGEAGVVSVLNILKDEFHLAMGLAGCSSIDEISKIMVAHETHYSKL
ncbi:peroxisomal (S)-2-hydroxy-acid oxidase GLO5-like [Xenia sp. Carnegie-2017]|uniref:peroxisomal (S)-2-hydroxy-acid oxidase GLO5-like n=1 Tax=Xenia sp. Carnegie-2017 TaxID=2897299 RepID=UPI001F040F97|nr:peroxisomal (S)-2-hydroxy-acid oxidase GLO5-like [Xenia sp. Carnegie-2017]